MDGAGGTFGAGQGQEHALSGERIEETRRVADEHRARRPRPAHAVRERSHRDPRSDPQRRAERSSAPGERRRRPADSRVDVGRPARQPRAGDDDHHVGPSVAQRVEGEIRTAPDVHLDETVERTEAGVVSADGIARAAMDGRGESQLPRDDRSDAVGPDDDARRTVFEIARRGPHADAGTAPVLH